MAIGIREAREMLPSLIKRAAYGNEDILVGTRGSDEVAIVSAKRFASIKDELAHLRAEVLELKRSLGVRSSGGVKAQDEPFAGLQRALDEGRLGVAPGPRARRTFVAEPGSSVSREERIRLGSRGNHEPERRRPGPRA
jgi:PHD/YefM family antitoxin component YafN of YafNO toxin-antitoxin module